MQNVLWKSKCMTAFPLSSGTKEMSLQRCVNFWSIVITCKPSSSFIFKENLNAVLAKAKPTVSQGERQNDELVMIMQCSLLH